MQKEVTTIRLDKQLRAKLNVISEKENRSISNIIEQSILEFVKKYKTEANSIKAGK